jgi:hypothetical protein
MDDATLTSYDAAVMDRLILVLLLFLMIVMMMVVIHCLLLRKEGSINDAVFRDLLVVTQRLLDVQLRLSDGGEEGQVMVSSSASDHQLMMDNAAATKKKAAAAAKKKKRNKRNKATAKHKGGTKFMSWLGGGGGITSHVMMVAAFSSISITTLIFTLSLIHQSDGSREGKAPPALPPSISTSLRQGDLHSSDVASESPNIISSPLAAVVPPPVFSPTATAVRNPPTSADKTVCVDTPGWEDAAGLGCKFYGGDIEGCPITGHYPGNIGTAKEHCCHCGGGIRTVSLIQSRHDTTV